jgi:hypothetical protein
MVRHHSGGYLQDGGVPTILFGFAVIALAGELTMLIAQVRYFVVIKAIGFVDHHFLQPTLFFRL